MIGQPVPDVVLKTRVRDESIGGPNPFRWQDVSTGDVFAKGRHVLFALPGAFTPASVTGETPSGGMVWPVNHSNSSAPSR